MHFWYYFKHFYLQYSTWGSFFRAMETMLQGLTSQSEFWECFVKQFQLLVENWRKIEVSCKNDKFSHEFMLYLEFYGTFSEIITRKLLFFSTNVKVKFLLYRASELSIYLVMSACIRKHQTISTYVVKLTTPPSPQIIIKLDYSYCTTIVVRNECMG